MHSSCSSTTNDLSDENKHTKTTNSNKKLVIIGLPLSPLNPSSFLFFKSTSPTITNNKPSANLQRLFTESSHTLIRNLHNSIDKCLSSLHHFASNNPLFIKLRSISSEYHKFNQINWRNQRNLKCDNFAAILPGDSMAGLVVSNGISNFLNIYNTLLVVRLVLTWFPNSPPAIVSPLSTLCDPYLNIFRGLIPPLGGTLDLSPILAFLVLNALTSSASALPAELPSHLTTSQTKWVKRFDSRKSKGSSIDESTT